ncbi:MAG: hypothetical protein KAR24_01910 [Candidatus Pacebacteria bacterium]|nr:hypothetical protein [Candidatus Paceibacterota bacterium]
MEKNKKIFYIIILVFMICLVVGFKQSQNSKVNTNTNNEKQAEVETAAIEFDENMDLEEAQGMIYEKYSNDNLRIVGAVIQEVTSDYVIVKTYRAGVGTESIVEEKKINITSDIPIFETVISFDQQEDLDNEPVTTRKTIASLKAGDHIVIECADDKNMKDSNEFTALIITKDVLIFDEPVEDEDVE